MNSYLVNFAAYTFAMIGFIAIAVFIYKKSMYSSCGADKNKNFLKVENSLRLSATKTIYVLKAGGEKFLIAADNASTTMLSKLKDVSDDENYKSVNTESFSDLAIIKRRAQKVNRG